MDLDEDLSSDVLERAMPGRALRCYPAMLSTESDALGWARSGGPAGAVVVAGYQASPRGRAGLTWEVRPGLDLGFSLVLRPTLTSQREGWVYSTSLLGVCDVLGQDLTLSWPDEVYQGTRRVAAIGAHVELGPDGVAWAVVNVLVPDVSPPRGRLLAELVGAIEARALADPDGTLADYNARCDTIGRAVCARLIPMGSAGPQVRGTAVTTLADGALVILTAKGNRVAVPPHNLGLLDDLSEAGLAASALDLRFERLQPVDLLDERPPQAPVDVVHPLAGEPLGDL